MSTNDELREAIMTADEQDQIGYVRYLCELYLKDHPGHARTLVMYARSLISLGQYADAFSAVDRAESSVSEEHLQYVFSLRGHLLEAQGDFAAAEKMFLKAYDLDPADATYLIFAASTAFSRGDLVRAETLARQATQCPEGAIDEAFFNLGGYLLSQRQYQEAVLCYRKALEIDSDYALAKERLADVELILKREESDQ